MLDHSECLFGHVVVLPRTAAATQTAQHDAQADEMGQERHRPCDGVGEIDGLNGVEAGNLTLRDKETVFRCPLKTYSYRLQLINGGVTNFHFHSIVIQEVIHETEERNKKTKKSFKKGKKL